MKALEICKVEAYERKASAGGKFSFVMVVRSLDVYGTENKGEPVARIQGDVFETQQEAFTAGYRAAYERANDRSLTVAHFSSNKFRKNYTIWA
jgi:hypothetical protein